MAPGLLMDSLLMDSLLMDSLLMDSLPMLGDEQRAQQALLVLNRLQDNLPANLQSNAQEKNYIKA